MSQSFEFDSGLGRVVLVRRGLECQGAHRDSPGAYEIILRTGQGDVVIVGANGTGPVLMGRWRRVTNAGSDVTPEETPEAPPGR